MNYPTDTVAKVNAVNNVRKEINRLAPLMIAAFTPLVGQKIMKAGGLMEKFKSLVPQSSLQMYRNCSNYTLSFTVKDCQSGPQRANYFEETFYIGDLENGLVLKKMYDYVPRKDNYMVSSVIFARNDVLKAKAALADAMSNLHPFGEYDN